MRIIAVYLFLFALCLLTACRPAAAPKSISNVPVSINDVPVTGPPLPPTKPLEEMTWANFDGATNLDGGTSKLKDFQGKAVILDFWATYCPPCIEEIPHLKELQAKYGKENLVVIGLHVGGEDDRPKVPAFVEKLKIDYTVATPENELVRFVFGGTDSIPQTAIFDRNGKMVRKIVGFDKQVKQELDTAIEKALSAR